MKKFLLGVALLGFSLPAAFADSCSFFRDAKDIPHFTVHTRNEGFECMGYFHGLDRAWQSDYLRRTALGERSEVEGYSALKDDLKLRLFGFSTLADHIVATLDAKSLETLQAYSRGWNKGAAEAVRSGSVYELKEWKQKFKPWTPRDSVALLILQAFDQTRRAFEMRFTQSALAGKYGKYAETLNSEYGTPWDTTVIKSDDVSTAALQTSGKVETKVAELSPAEKARARELADFFKFTYLDFLGDSSTKGSNNWVLAGNRMEGGNAVLMNDPHLALTTPSFWYWMEMNVDGEGSALGATLPGGPLFTSGLNEKVSWGLTNAFFDVYDVAFVAPEMLPDLKTFRPKVYIKVAGAQIPFSLKKFSHTKEGYPILPIKGPKGKVALLKWTAYHLEGKDFAAVLDVPFTKNVAEADKVFGRIGFPSWNYVFADVDGKIGHRVIGKLPKMASAHFGVPTLETAAEVQAFRNWTFLTDAEAPHVTNPARGFIATANEQSWPKGSPLSAGIAQVPSFRAFRIEEGITKKSKHTLEDLRAIQCDVQYIDARFVRPLMIKYLEHEKAANPKPDGYEEKAVAELKSWNGIADVKCVGCSVYFYWMKALQDEFAGNETAVYKLFMNSSAYGVDPAAFQASVLKAWNSGLASLKKLNATSIPVWETIHRAPFRHLSNRDGWNPRNPIATPGGENSVDPGSTDDAHPTEHRSGASMRTQIEMSRPPKVWMQPGGIQKDLENPDLNATDSEWRNWRDCKYPAMPFPSTFPADRLTTVRW
jgi:penicillin amidase